MTASSLDAFLDRDRFDLEEVARALASSSDARRADLSLAHLVELGARLPSGLVHAETIALFAEPPQGVAPLAEGSAWFAAGNALVAVPRRSKAAMRRMLLDLASYFLIAERFRLALESKPVLVEALARPELDASMRVELALALDAPAALLGALDAHAPALRADLVAMASRPFRPVLRIHAALRSAHLAVRGARIAQELFAQLPDGPVRLLVTDTPTALEHLSPYVRDLGLAISTWGLENPERLSTGGLADALREAGDRASVDLAALVAGDLVEQHPDLLLERREAERSAGLYLFDAEDVVFGFAELSRLALPDEHAVPKGASGTVAIISTRAEAAIVEVARALFDSGRVVGAAFVLAAAMDVPGVIVADALVSDHDGVALTRAEELADRAARLGIEAHRVACVRVDDQLGAPGIAFALLGLQRRGQALGRGGDQGAALLLYPLGRAVSTRAFQRRLWEVEAGRLAINALSIQDDTCFPPKTRQGVSHKSTGVPRRFRA